jgi:zinc/manganese transport system permease protein
VNWGVLDPTILGPALAAGLLVLSTHVPLGRQVIQRGIIFIDLAVAQMAALGLLAAQAWGGARAGLPAEVFAYGAALLGALALAACERRWAAVQEAVIGVAFVLAATGGILLLAGNPHGGDHFQSLLAGQILWVEYRDLLPVAALYALVLAAWYLMGPRAGAWLFYVLFAATVTAAVQLVGVYLVFATLIVPALVVRRYGPSGLVWGYLIGVVGYGLGLMVSALWDLPAGPVVVWALFLVALGFRVVRPRAGMVAG